MYAMYIFEVVVYIIVVIISSLLILKRKSICYGRLEHRNFNTWGDGFFVCLPLPLSLSVSLLLSQSISEFFVSRLHLEKKKIGSKTKLKQCVINVVGSANVNLSKYIVHWILSHCKSDEAISRRSTLCQSSDRLFVQVLLGHFSNSIR